MSAARAIVRPAEGRRVRDPGSGEPIPTEGREVNLNTFFRRRIAKGDLELVDMVEPTAPTADEE